MLTLCPQCRAPSNLRQTSCWVCRRVFDGSEPKIGVVPYARPPLSYQERVSPTLARTAAEPAALEAGGWGDVSERRALVAGRR
jgi:hypothetical protein